MAQNPMSAGEYAGVKRAVRVMSKLQTPIYRLSGGRIWGSFSGRRVCLITMTGAKSGRRRTIPLMYVPWGKEDEGAVYFRVTLGRESRCFPYMSSQGQLSQKQPVAK